MEGEGGVFLREGRRLTMHCFRNKLCRRLNATFDQMSVSGLGNFESKKSIPSELTGRCESSVTPHWHGARAKCLKSQVRRDDGSLRSSVGEEEDAADARVPGDHEQELEHPAVVSAPPGVRPQLGGEHLEERHVQEGAAGDALEEPI